MPTPETPPILDPAIRPALRPALPTLIAGVFTAALAGLSLLGGTWCLVRFIGDPSSGWVFWAVVLWLLGAALGSLSSWLAHHAEARFEARLRREVAGHLVRMPARSLSRYRGDALRRLVSDDIGALHHLIAHLPAEITTMIVVPAVTIVLLVTAAGPVALIALIPGLVAALFSLIVIPKMAARYVEENATVMSDIATAVDDYTRGIHVSRIYGADSGAAAVYHGATARFISGMVTRVRLVATPAAIGTALLQAAATFALAYAVGFRWDAQSLAAALLFSLAIVTPALRLGHGLDYVGAGQAAMARIAEVLREPILASGERLAPGRGAELRADRLTVRIGERVVLNGLSHTFRTAALTAITGPSGGGKSTLLRALAGLEPVDDGAALLAGMPVSELTEEARTASILFIPQGGDVLPAPVRETVTLSTSDPAAIGSARIRTALERAQLDIDPNSDAQTLSGGEKQRVGLARAFLSDAPVILLDEPTSALDSETASKLIAELRQRAREDGTTVILVTHDPVLAQQADDRLDLDPITLNSETSR